MTVDIDAVLGLLPGHVKTASGWAAKCPAHSDANPSLSIALAADNSVLLHCHAGCDIEEILTSLNLSWSDIIHSIGPGISRGKRIAHRLLSMLEHDGCLCHDKPNTDSSTDNIDSIFLSCPIVRDDPNVVDFLSSYCIDINAIPDDWKIYDHPALGKGILYRAINPDKTSSYKYKTINRNNDGKRDSRLLSGNSLAAFIYKTNKDTPLIITGGEEKGAFIYSLGFNSFSLAMGEKDIGDSWASVIASWDCIEIILAFDNDKAGATATDKTFFSLRKAGISRHKIKRIIWPSWAKSGYDITDAAVDKGSKYAWDLIAAAESIPATSMNFLSVNSVLSMNAAGSECYMGDRVVSAGNIFALFGAGGIGKSRVMLDIAIACVLGEEWCGIETHATGKKWLFIQTENDAYRIKRDISKMISGMHQDDVARLNNCIKILVPISDFDVDTALISAVNIDKIKLEVMEHRPDIVVFDPLSDFYAGDNENDAMQMKDSIMLINNVAKAASNDVTPVIIHHAAMGKEAMLKASGYDRGNFGRGSKALYNKARSTVNIMPGSSDEDNDTLIVLCGKNNNGMAFSRRAITLNCNMRYTLDADFDFEAWEEELSASSAKKKHNPINSNVILGMISPGQSASLKEINDSLLDMGFNKTSIIKSISDMIDNGLIKKIRVAGTVYYTR